MISYNRKIFANRLASLRLKKGASAREMSLSIGQSPNYINRIEGEKTYPSMTVFFQICEYLDITPKEFFDIGPSTPVNLSDLFRELDSLDDTVIGHILAIAQELNKK